MQPELLSPDPLTRDAPREILRRVFGFSAFRGLQEEAITQVVGGGDALVLMPTGGGKSICYQVPALCRPGTAIVISPLIALMDDQVAALRQLGIAAGALHSDLDPDEQRRIGRELDAGRLDLLYVSPERLLSPGHDGAVAAPRHRPAGDRRGALRQPMGPRVPPGIPRACLPAATAFPGVPRIALTATADPRTRARHPARAGYGRRARCSPRASIARTCTSPPRPKIGETAQLLALLRRHPGEAGIVYCGSRNKTERIAAWLEGKGIPAIAFHAGLAARAEAGGCRAVPFRRGGGGGRHHRLRHGHRPPRRAVRRASRHAGQPRGLLPADRPRWPRRRSRRHAAAVRRRGHRPGPLFPADLRRAGGAEAGDAPPGWKR